MILLRDKQGKDFPIDGIPQDMTLGRAQFNLKHPKALSVSREQCRVALIPTPSFSPSKVLLTSVAGQNPTLIIRNRSQQKIQISAGQNITLEFGDKICMLSTDPAEFLELLSIEGEKSELGQQRSDMDSFCSEMNETKSGPSNLEESQNVRIREPSGNDDIGIQPSVLPNLSVPFPKGLHLPDIKRQIMLVMVGVPGSGKSTFSENLEAHSQAWKRVNQDTVKGGTRGTRQQCLNCAQEILRQGRSVIVDRCNVDIPQRQDFLDLALSLNIEVHAVVLNLPLKMCQKQAMERFDHEGGLSGNEAHRVVGQMNGVFRKAGLPQKKEGFASIVVCSSHKDIEIATEIYKTLPLNQLDCHPETVFQEEGGNRGSLKQLFQSKSVSNTPKKTQSTPSKSIQNQKTSVQTTTHTEFGTGSQSMAQIGLLRLHGGSQKSQAGPDEHRQDDSSLEKSQIGLLNSSTALKEENQTENDSLEPPRKVPKNAFSTMLTASKKAAQIGNQNLKNGGSQQQKGTGLNKPNFARGFQAEALRRAALNPQSEAKNHAEMEISQDFVIIMDKYPKAKLHGLVVSRDPKLEGPGDLRSEHLPLLELMENAAIDWADAKQPESKDTIRLGFHAIPSLPQLHLHVISQDFDSSWLKSKKHWNSFTTDFFLGIDEVKAKLRKQESLNINYAEMKEVLNQRLTCHICAKDFSTIPSLKSHFVQHVEKLKNLVRPRI